MPVPPFKRSLVFDTSALVWPWQLAGLDLGPAERITIATHAGGDDLALWAVLPLVAGLLAGVDAGAE